MQIKLKLIVRSNLGALRAESIDSQNHACTRQRNSPVCVVSRVSFRFRAWSSTGQLIPEPCDASIKFGGCDNWLESVEPVGNSVFSLEHSALNWVGDANDLSRRVTDGAEETTWLAQILAGGRPLAYLARDARVKTVEAVRFRDWRRQHAAEKRTFEPRQPGVTFHWSICLARNPFWSAVSFPGDYWLE